MTPVVPEDEHWNSSRRLLVEKMVGKTRQVCAPQICLHKVESLGIFAEGRNHRLDLGEKALGQFLSAFVFVVLKYRTQISLHESMENQLREPSAAETLFQLFPRTAKCGITVQFGSAYQRFLHRFIISRSRRK